MNEKQRKTLQRNNEAENSIVRESLTQALLLLLRTKSLEQITITELAKKAGVSRNAYYRNFRSKNALLNSYLRDIIHIINKTLSQYDPITNTYNSWLALLSQIKSIQWEYPILLKAGYEAKIMNEAEKILDNKSSQDTRVIYENHFWVGALCSVVATWVKDDCQTNPHEIAKICSHLMTNGLLASDIK